MEEETEPVEDCFHSLIVISNLKALFDTQTLCDVKIITSEGELGAHKVILAASSSYFKALFCSPLCFNENEINLTDLDPDAVESVVSYMYTSKISLSEKNIISIMEVEDLLQVTSLRSLCCHFLKSELNSSNCWIIKAQADFRSLVDIANLASLYIREHFEKLIASSEFLDVPFELIMDCLNSTHLAIPEEEVLLSKLCSWVLHLPQERLRHLNSLLNKVDVSKISHWKGTKDFITNLFLQADIYEAIEEWINTSDEKRLEKLSDGPRYKECLTNVVLAIGGCHGNQVLGTIECLPSHLKPWRLSLPVTTADNQSLASPQNKPFPVMKYPRWGAAVASTPRKIYLIGGWGGFGTGNELTSVEMYDVETNEWSELPSLPKVICSGASDVLDGKLYFCGGFTPHKTTTDGLWVLTENASTWRPLAPMNHCRREHGLVAVNGALFAVGGLGGDGQSLKSVERYDPLTDTWIQVAPMITPRMRHGCVAIDNCIYVIRGKIVTDSKPIKTDEIQNERYNTLTNEWTALTSSQAGRRMAQRPVRSVVYGKSIVSTGGSSGLCIEVYNTLIDETTDGPTLNQPRTGHSLASIKVPLFKKPPI